MAKYSSVGLLIAVLLLLSEMHFAYPQSPIPNDGGININDLYQTFVDEIKSTECTILPGQKAPKSKNCTVIIKLFVDKANSEKVCKFDETARIKKIATNITSFKYEKRPLRNKKFD